jgi:GR25 family glycosyltransferase involved in LPS biosynthesis
MKSFYINLDNAVARRNSIEDSFARHNNCGWTLERFQAVDAPGILRDEEKACFLSHRKLIGENANADEPIFVLEDDTCFAELTFATVDGLLRPPTPPRRVGFIIYRCRNLLDRRDGGARETSTRTYIEATNKAS